MSRQEREAAMVVTTPARRIARLCNRHGEPGFVGLFDRDGNWLDWVCGPGGGVSLNPVGRARGSILYRVSHGHNTARDVQRCIDEQYAPVIGTWVAEMADPDGGPPLVMVQP